MVEKSATKVVNEFKGLKSDRSNFESQWQEITDYVLPSRPDFLTSRSKGQRRPKPLDSSATLSVTKLVGSLQSLLVSESLRWFTPMVPDSELMRVPENQMWLQGINEQMEAALASPSSGFYYQHQQTDFDTVPFGTGVTFVEEDTRLRLPVFHSIPLNEIYLGAGDVTNRAFRLRKYGVYEVVEMFDDIPDYLIQRLERHAKGTPNAEIEVLHAVYPNSKFNPNELPVKSNKKFSSVYIWCEEEEILSTGGYDEFPYFVKRWDRLTGEIYGRGPGMYALPDVRVLNKLTERILRNAENITGNAFQAPSDAFTAPLDLRSNMVNYYDPSAVDGVNDVIRPIKVAGDLRLGVEFLDRYTFTIAQHFHNQLLQEEKNAEMSATEAAQNQENRMRILGNIVARFGREYYTPILRRVYNILRRTGRISEPPPDIKGQDFLIEYMSPLHQAQKITQVAKNDRFANRIVEVAGVFPEVTDTIRPLQFVERMARDLNITREILATQEEFNQKQEAKAQQRQALQQAETAEKFSKAGTNLAKIVELNR